MAERLGLGGCATQQDLTIPNSQLHVRNKGRAIVILRLSVEKNRSDRVSLTFILRFLVSWLPVHGRKRPEEEEISGGRIALRQPQLAQITASMLSRP